MKNRASDTEKEIKKHQKPATAGFPEHQKKAMPPSHLSLHPAPLL